jgi:DNA-binding transcriptional MerR regulator
VKPVQSLCYIKGRGNMNLSAVVRLVGINENTLRAWERRYGAVTPTRDEKGRRVYSNKEVEKIKLLWSLVNEGHSIGLIAKLSHAKLKSMLTKTLSPHVIDIRPVNGKAEEFLTSIIRALEKFNLEGLHQNLQRARFEMTIKEIVIDLIKPLMEKVGKLNATGKLSIAQEHLLSSLLRDYLGNIHQSLSPYDFSSRKLSKSVLFTTREGDLHEFNILMGAILSNVYHFRTYYLGTNMPAEDLAQSCDYFKPNYIVLGLTDLPQGLELITPQKYMMKLDKLLPRYITICYGGSSNLVINGISRDRELIKITGLSDLDQFLASKSII